MEKSSQAGNARQVFGSCPYHAAKRSYIIYSRLAEPNQPKSGSAQAGPSEWFKPGTTAISSAQSCEGPGLTPENNQTATRPINVDAYRTRSDNGKKSLYTTCDGPGLTPKDPIEEITKALADFGREG